MTPKLINSRFAVKACPVCGHPIAEGASVWYDKDAQRGKKSWCEAHGAFPAGKPASPAAAPAAQPLPPVTIAPAGSRPAVERLTASDGRRLLLQRWDSLADYVASAHPDAAVQDAAGEAARVAKRYWNDGNNPDWHGIDGGAAAVIGAVTHGWADGLARMMEDKRQLENSLPPPQSIKRRRQRGDFGDTLHMPDVWAGRLDSAWERCARTASNAPRVITLVASMQGLSKTKPEVFFWRGAAIALLADILNEAGYSVEIVADYTCDVAKWGRLPATHICHRITLKPATAPLDLGSIAAALGLSGFKRTVGFANLHNTAYQLHGKPEMEWYSQAAPQLDPAELVGVEAVENQRSAVEWVKQQLAAIGGQQSQPLAA